MLCISASPTVITSTTIALAMGILSQALEFFLTTSSFLDLGMALCECGGKLESSVKWKVELKFRFLEGAEVAKREVCNDIEEEMIESANGDVEDKVEAIDDQEKNERRVAPPSQAAVVSVLCLRSSLFLVQVKFKYCVSQSAGGNAALFKGYSIAHPLPLCTASELSSAFHLVES